MTTKEIVEKLNAYLKENNFSHSVWQGGKENEIQTEIIWGDWKHDHLRVKYLVNQFMRTIGHTVAIPHEVVTEQDGSDCYSAIHTWEIKNIY